MKKVGILGTGWVATYHVQALSQLGVEISAVVGSTAEKAEAFAREWNIPNFGANPEILVAPEIGAVHICTPPHKHYEQICLLLAHGKHIFCEKPLTLSATEAEKLAKMAEESQCICTVGFNVRSFQRCRQARELVQEETLGRLLLIHGSYLQEFGAEPAMWSWRYESDLHAVTEIGSHWLDLAQYISGEKITAVSALLDRFHPIRYRKEGLLYTEPQKGAETVPVPSEDVALIHFRTESGAIGSVVLSELSHGHGNQLTMELTGEKATLAWNNEDPTTLTLSHKGQTERLKGEEDFFENTFLAQFRDFYGAIRGEAPYTGSDFREAYRNTLLCEAIQKSAERDSAWVEVPL